MSMSAKRRRTTAVGGKSRASILATFAMTNSDGDSSSFRLTKVPAPAPSTEQRSSILRATSLLDSVACISTQRGRDAVQILQTNLAGRLLTSSEVLEHLLEDDGEAPPLCILALLLENGHVRPSELPYDDLLLRAYDVVTVATDRRCVCPEKCSGAMTSIVLSLAASGRSRSRDDGLNLFLQPLLQNGTVSPSHGSHADALRLSERVLQDLKDADMGDGDRFELLQSWIQTSVVSSPMPNIRPASTSAAHCEDTAVRRFYSRLLLFLCFV